MKILIVCFWNMPLTGGVATYMDNLKKGLEKEGHDVDIFGQEGGVHGSYLFNGQSLLPKYKIRDVVNKEVHRFFVKHQPHLPVNVRILEAQRYSFEFAATLLDLGKYDVIHCQDVISARLLSRINVQKRPIVTTIHGCLTFEMEHGGVFANKLPSLRQYYVGIERLGISAGDQVIVPTRWLHGLLSRHFVSLNNSHIIPYGIDRERFLRQMNAPTQLTSDRRYTIVCPARLDPVKGHTVLFDALVKLKQQRTDWVCLLLGKGPLRPKLEALCRRLQLEQHVLFLGNRRDVPALMKQADIVVLPSLQDNQPFAVMEAQLAGKPLAVSNAGGIPEMVHHGHTGLVSAVNESVPLYKNLLTLLNDSSLRERLGNEGNAWANDQWPLQKMVQRTLAVYEQTS